jgi:putative cell wall-binding protein
MGGRRMGRRAAAIAALAVAVSGIGNVSVGATEGASVERLAGTDRIATALAVADDGFPGGADAAVLVRSDTYPDALSGGPLAVAKGGPLLLTQSTALDGRVATALDELLEPGATVYLLGGTGALSPAVEQAVQGRGYATVRYGGLNRFETAVIVAEQGLASPDAALLANGLAFADPLIAAAAAPAADGAVLLTSEGTLPTETSAYLAEHSPSSVFAIGDLASDASPSSERLAGADAFATAVVVAERFFDDPDTVAVASGTNFPDALSGGAHIGLLGGPLLLTQAGSLPASTASYLDGNAGTISRAVVYGGTAAVSDAVVGQVANAVDTSVRFGDGTYQVGEDIPAGTYRTRTDPPGGGCYWERLAGFSGELSDINANEFTDTHAVVTIESGDVGFRTDGCGTWTSDLSAITASPTAPFEDGTWIVGTDVQAGTWSAPGGEGCYWARLNGFSGELADIESNDFGSTNPVVEVSSADAGFMASGCGEWSLD